MRKIVTSAAAALAFVAALAWLLGPRGAAAGAAIAFLGLAWRHDNQTGACLPLAILLLLVVGVMFVLLYMLILTAPH
ncbi:MAG TPA: hypothetical protein VGC56_03085 [Allosphingosinicella sp.]|jgi:hypothetical protein